jgi:hypothetical protein
VNEHEQQAMRARNARKVREKKRPSRWLEKRNGPVTARSREPDPPEPEPEPQADPLFEEHAVVFFNEGETPTSIPALELDLDADADAYDDDGAVSLRRPRRSYARHVMAVVAVSLVVCVAALLRSVSSAPAAPSAATAPAAAFAPWPRAAATEVAAPAAPPPATPVAEVADLPPAPEEALAAREDARRLLEKGAGADALVAARASVALDPTDAEAWLVLGATYQMLGKTREAHEAFESCVRVAKRGRSWECRALL